MTLILPQIGGWYSAGGLPPAEGWPDVSTAVYDGVSFSVSGQDGTARGVFFKPDGTKMYMIGDDTNRVYQYTLPTPWDLSTTSYDGVSVLVSAWDSAPRGLFFKPDGTKMYMVGFTSKKVYQYTLPTPWDFSTTSYDGVSFAVGGQDSSPRKALFNVDGTKMYMLGSSSVYQYTLSTPWDLSTTSYDSISFAISGQDSLLFGLFFKPDGTKMYMVGYSSDRVHQYTLSTPWDLSTASYDSISFAISGQDGLPMDLSFSSDGTKMYMIGFASDRVYQYSLG